jgi:hypothetical protein
MLNEFENWFAANASALQSKGFVIKVIRPHQKTDKMSIRAEVDTPNSIAVVWLWDSGEIESEALDEATGQMRFNRYAIIHGAEEMNETLKRFFTELSRAA